MSASVVPPPILSEDAFRRLLVERVDERCLSVGMVVGLTEANRHRIVAHGCRDRSGAGPVNEKTLFEIGSITKLFTALLLSDMANRGEVSMDEPVAELLPRGTRVPFRDSKAITLRDLASHYSGLPRVATNGDRPDRPGGPYAAYSAERLYQFLAGHELTRTPGDSFEYSNVGVGLLGHALVLRAGASGYESLIRARILDPLRMDDTVIAIPSRLAGNVASGHDDSLGADLGLDFRCTGRDGRAALDHARFAALRGRGLRSELIDCVHHPSVDGSARPRRLGTGEAAPGWRNCVIEARRYRWCP
jgi:D-alanyl-D-alanine-carboxypeptidase/D-alanyl-D-alanine-endopeptidase